MLLQKELLLQKYYTSPTPQSESNFIPTMVWTQKKEPLQAVHTAAAVRKAKAAIKKAFENTLAKKGTSVVEIVSTCNSGWKLSPAESNNWMAEHMFEKYPLGDLKNE